MAKKKSAKAASEAAASSTPPAAALADTGAQKPAGSLADSLDNARDLMASGAYNKQQAGQFLKDSEPAHYKTLAAAVAALDE